MNLNDLNLLESSQVGEMNVGVQAKSVWDKSVKIQENGYYWRGVPLITRVKSVHSSQPIVVELFCGCGGTSLGFEMAGFNVVLGCDIHAPAIKTFQANHPAASTILGDVKKIDPDEVKDILDGRALDVLIAGVPCQGFSLNNRKRHQGDDRNLMYKEFVRFIEILKPRAIVLENVSGMKSTGNFVQEIERDLSEVGSMTVKSKMLYAPDYGVPQKRSRLVFVGVKGEEFDFDRIEKTHGPEAGKPYVTVKEAIGDLPSLKPKQTKNRYQTAPQSDYQKLMRLNTGKNLSCHTAPNHPLHTIARIKTTKPGEPMYPKFKQRIRLSWEMLSPTQVSGGIRPQFQLGHPEDARGLTIRERCRIQSFPDDFVVLGGLVQGRVQTGNAVPPLLAKAVALAINSYL